MDRFYWDINTMQTAAGKKTHLIARTNHAEEGTGLID